ncbi:MAG: amidohydrolase family protein [Spirochaetaceae bacterium]|jgi:dihydroorotase|nr:amidohydrolase family protein [Spirochaetaceae bacterium]
MAHRLILKNFRLVDETMDRTGSVLIEDGFIRDVIPGPGPSEAGCIIDGGRLYPQGSEGALVEGSGPVLLPALVDLHAHFRDPGFPDSETGVPAETLESAGLAAAAGGYGTVACMANTKPVIDTLEKAARLKSRSDALGLIDLYPVLSLTRAMEGRELSGITALASPEAAGETASRGPYVPRLLSEDGRDVADDGLFLAALTEARCLGLPVSCHCDAGGPEAEAARRSGAAREVWSRIEENHGSRRAIDLGRKAGCHIHIAHVSTKEAVDLIRAAKKTVKSGRGGVDATPGSFFLTCEATPHHIALTEEAARRLGLESHGRVNPPLRTEEDRQALIAALLDGTIDAIATDHAPHTQAGKAGGAPGFTGLETAFGVCLTELVRENGSGGMSLSQLSALMSGAPARILGLGKDRGRIAAGFRADFVIANINAARRVEAGFFKSRGNNSPFSGRELRGIILMTIRGGRVVFDAPMRYN